MSAVAPPRASDIPYLVVNHPSANPPLKCHIIRYPVSTVKAETHVKTCGNLFVPVIADRIFPPSGPDVSTAGKTKKVMSRAVPPQKIPQAM